MEIETLPIETFESFMMAGDSPDFPMSFAFEFELDGKLNISRLDDAIETAVRHHPLLVSVFDSDDQCWLFESEQAVFVEQARDYESALQFDLESEVGLRVIIPNPESDHQRIGFVFHHACVDGVGAFQFINDVAEAYSSQGKVEESSEDPDDDDFMNRHEDDAPQQAMAYLSKYRKSYGSNRVLHFLRWPFDLLGMLWAFEVVFKRPKPLQPESSPVDGQEKSAAKCKSEKFEFALTPEQTSQAIKVSKSNGQTLNDRIVEAIFLGIVDWNTEFNPSVAAENIRLMVPMNLRRKPAKSAANMVAMVNFDRKAGRWKSAKKFRKYLKLEMNVVKQIRAGVTANRFLGVQKLIFGGWPMQKKQNRCLATCMVSNVGVLDRLLGQAPSESGSFKMGELTGTRFRSITPLRPQTNLFVFLFSYANQLNFDVTFNANVLKREQVEFFVDAAMRNLLQDDPSSD